MTKKCELTGVLPLKGHNVSHANNKTKRRFLPNLKKISFDFLKVNQRLQELLEEEREVDHVEFEEFLVGFFFLFIEFSKFLF